MNVNVALSQEHGGPPPFQAFEEGAPQIGEPLPDITIFDDQGNPVNLRELATENYTVLVLGCLT
jgi:hypothetical protein